MIAAGGSLNDPGALPSCRWKDTSISFWCAHTNGEGRPFTIVAVPEYFFKELVFNGKKKKLLSWQDLKF